MSIKLKVNGTRITCETVHEAAALLRALEKKERPAPTFRPMTSEAPKKPKKKHGARKVYAPKGFWTDARVLEVYERIQKGETPKRLAHEYGTTDGGIRQALYARGFSSVRPNGATK